MNTPIFYELFRNHPLHAPSARTLASMLALGLALAGVWALLLGWGIGLGIDNFAMYFGWTALLMTILLVALFQQDLQRYRSLYAERAVSRQLLDQQQATVDQLRATLKANDATINAERVRLSYTRITSPVSGKVGIRNVDVGNLVRVGDSLGLFSVTQIAPISVVFSLQQEQLLQLQALLEIGRAHV